MPSAPSPRIRRLAASCLALAAAIAFTPTSAATLGFTMQQGSTFDIWATGATTWAEPHNLTIAPSASGYDLSWSPPSGTLPTGYRVYRLPGPGASGGIVSANVGSTTTFQDTSRPAGTYVYLVTAVFPTQESIPANPASTRDVSGPHCAVVSVYSSPPYLDTHISCLFEG